MRGVARPERPNPTDLVREARRCEELARRWETRYLGDAPVSVAELIHAHGRAGYWEEQARRWEAAARAACGSLRWALWCRRHRLPPSWRTDDRGGVAWPQRAPRH